MKKVYLFYPEKLGTIAPEIYGHFAEHIGGVFYDGLWVGRDSNVPNINGFRKFIVDKLKTINPPVIRWPGGCFAEIYDWRDGIGENRPTRINWWHYCDKRYESNQVGTHEFVELCELVGAKPYFAANVTSVTPMHIRNWMDYCLSPRGSTTLAKEREKNGRPEPFYIPYWGVGNENWGGGGNMPPEVYAVEYRRYAAIMNNTATGIKFIGCGPNSEDYNWTRKFMDIFRTSDKFMHGFSLHYYCGGAGDPVNFTVDEWDELIHKAGRMEEILLRHWSIIQGFGLDNQIKLVIDEWGCWHPKGSGPSKGYNLFEQQSTMRDAVVAALTLNIFNNHCDKIMMANVAQLVNNLHCLFLAGGEHCIVTPTYHVFDMYKDHQGAAAIKTYTDADKSDLSVSASVKDGFVTVTIANLSAKTDLQVSLKAVDIELHNNAQITVLANADMHAHSTFENPDAVKPFTVKVNPNDPITVPKAGVVSIKAKLNKK